MMVTTNRAQLVRESIAEYDKLTTLSSPSQMYQLLTDVFKLDLESTEHIMLVALDTKHNILSTTISIGTVNYSVCSTREIFQWLLLNDAVRFTIAHNHPSGNSKPSPEDLHLTLRMKEAGELMGISLLDHIIIGNGNYSSLKELGYIS